jgi:hypothetical protein
MPFPPGSAGADMLTSDLITPLPPTPPTWHPLGQACGLPCSRDPSGGRGLPPTLGPRHDIVRHCTPSASVQIRGHPDPGGLHQTR